MSLLITGGTGYIGKKLTNKINSKITDMYSIGREFNLSDYEKTFLFLKEKKIKKIIHLGWNMNNDKYSLYENLSCINNLVKMSDILNIDKVIFISTNNVYGTYKNKKYFENDFLYPDENNYYGISKYISEKILSYSLRERVCILRLGDVYGNNQNHGTLMKVIFDDLKNNNTIKLYGEGTRKRDYIYIDDVVNAIEFVYDKNLNGIYNIATGKGTSVREIIDIISKLYNNKVKIEKLKIENEDTSEIVLDTRKINSAGFKTKVSIEEGLKMIMIEKGVFNGKN